MIIDIKKSKRFLEYLNNFKETKNWLKNAIYALIFSLIYFVIFTVVRPEEDSFFIISAILLIICFFWVTSAIWSFTKNKVYFDNFFNKLSLIGMGLIVISPLTGKGRAIVTSYVPIIENICFVLGFSLFFSVILCFSIAIFIKTCYVFFYEKISDSGYFLFFFTITSSLMYVMLWVCCMLSYREIVVLSAFYPIGIDYYYKLLFFSASYFLQFIYTQIIIFVSVVLAEFLIRKELFHYQIYICLLLINFFLSFSVFYGHIFYRIAENQFTEFFARYLKFGDKISVIIFIFILFVDICRGCLASFGKS